MKIPAAAAAAAAKDIFNAERHFSLCMETISLKNFLCAQNLSLKMRNCYFSFKNINNIKNIYVLTNIIFAIRKDFATSAFPQTFLTF